MSEVTSKLEVAGPTRDQKITKVMALFIVAVISVLGGVIGKGWYDEDDAPVPAVEPIRARQVVDERVKQPLRVKLLMQRDAMCGEPVDLVALVTGGDVESCEFRVVPDGDYLRDSPDLLRDTFTTDVHGEYIIFVTVAGPNGEQSTDLGVIEMVNNKEAVPVPVPVPVGPDGVGEEEQGAQVPRMSQKRVELAPVKRSHFVNAVIDLVSKVQSPTILTDIPVIATSLRSAAVATTTGQLNGETPMGYAVEFASAQLGDAAAAWEPFFNGVNDLLSALTVLGLTFDEETVGMALADAATVLEGAGPN